MKESAEAEAEGSGKTEGLEAQDETTCAWDVDGDQVPPFHL